MTLYVAHLRRSATAYGTACGSAWQSWQEPDGRTPLDPPPNGPLPIPQAGTAVELCGACQRAALNADA